MIPGGAIAPECNIVALQTGNGDGQEVLETDAFRKGGIVGHDLVKAFLIVTHQVHLVDRQHHIADADQVNVIATTPRLRPEENTSELQSLLPIPYSVFCFTKKPYT